MIMAWRDTEGWLDIVFCNDGRVVDEKQSDVGRRWEWYGGYKWIWEIWSTTSLIGFRRPRIGDILRRIGTQTCRIRDGKLTGERNSRKSQFHMMIAPIPSHFSLSCPQLYHHLGTWSEVIPLYLSMTWSWVNAEYSVHQLLHLSMIVCLLLARFSSRSGCTQPSTFPQLRIQPIIRDSAPFAPLSWSTASKYCSHLDWSGPPRVSPNALNCGFQVHLWVHLISASKWISILTRSPPPSAYLRSLHFGVPMYLQTRSIPAPKCISEFTRCHSQCSSPIMLDDGLQVHLRRGMAGLQGYRDNGGGQRDGEYILGRPQSR